MRLHGNMGFAQHEIDEWDLVKQARKNGHLVPEEMTPIKPDLYMHHNIVGTLFNRAQLQRNLDEPNRNSGRVDFHPETYPVHDTGDGRAAFTGRGFFDPVTYPIVPRADPQKHPAPLDNKELTKAIKQPNVSIASLCLLLLILFVAIQAFG